MQDHQDLRNDFHWTGKIKQPAYKILRVWTKNEENFEKISRKFWDFFIKISTENWLFSQIFTKYFLECCLMSDSIYPWKITLDFYNNFSDFGGSGGSSDVPVYSRRYWIYGWVVGKSYNDHFSRKDKTRLQWNRADI